MCGDIPANNLLPKPCSGHGECVFENGTNYSTSKCICETNFNGRYCADGLKNLILYQKPSSSPQFERIRFIFTQANDNSKIKMFSLLQGAVFVIDDYIHTVGLRKTDLLHADYFSVAYTTKNYKLEDSVETSSDSWAFRGLILRFTNF